MDSFSDFLLVEKYAQMQALMKEKIGNRGLLGK